MAWVVLVRCDYYDRANQLCRIEIKEDRPTVIPSLIQGAVTPIRFIRPKKSKFDVIKGGGCELNLLSPTDRAFDSFFGGSPQKYRIEHTVASNMRWFGYLNPEVYSEPYDEDQNYFIQLYGNDGFALLDKMYFLDGSDDPYEGIETQWEVLQIILGKWGLMDLVSSVKIGLSTTSSEVTIAGAETILHETKVLQDNYYDEDGQPWTCRQVLNDILAPYGGVIYMYGSSVVITDINSLGGDISYKNYTNAFVFNSSSASLEAALDDLEDDIGYYEGGSRMELLPARNRQVVSYSPYANEPPQQTIQNVEDMTFSSGTAPSYTTIGSGTTQWANNISGLLGWTFNEVSNTNRLVAYREDSSAEPEFVIRIINPNYLAGTVDTTEANNTHSYYTWDLPYIIGTEKAYFLKITGLIRALAAVDPYVYDSTAIYYVGLAARLWIGSDSFDISTSAWNSSTNEFTLMGGGYDGNHMQEWSYLNLPEAAGGSWSSSSNNPISEEGILIGIGSGLEGKIKLELTPFVTGWATAPYTSGWNSPTDSQTLLIRCCELKNFKIELLTRPELEPANTNDLEYIGEFSAAWKEQGEPVSLNHGTSGNSGTPFDRGGLIYEDGSGDNLFFTEHTRAAVTDTIESLLLNSIQANLEEDLVSLSVKINNTTGYHSIRYIDGTYHSGKVFMMVSSSLDQANGYEEIELEEVIEDSEIGSLTTSSRIVPKKFRNGRIYWNGKIL